MSQADRKGDERYYQAPEPQGAPDAGQVILRDGSTATLRPATPEDFDLLCTFLRSISKESYVRRFYAETPIEVAAERMLAPEPRENKLVLFVLAGDAVHPRLLATGEYVRESPEAEVAEVAFLVDDAFHGKGLGTLLLERLALVAARYGITRFTAVTMARNRPMISMFKSSGFAVERRLEYGDVEVNFSILPSRESVERMEMRERVATVASLYPFFHPRRVAVIGASTSPKSASQRLFKNLRAQPFAGEVRLVNPNLEDAAPSVAALPEPPDLAIIALPPEQVLAAVDACGVVGVRALVVVTTGFAETGAAGRALQEALAEHARAHGMRLIGPNSLGVMNLGVGLNASLAPDPPPSGSVAVSSQSGALGLAILEYAAEAGLGLSSFVSLGNKADVSSNDLLQYWEDDEATKLILLYLASFGNPRRFARLARRVGRKKPILAVKAGRAPLTAAEAGLSERAADALFQQTGVIRAETFEELFDVASLLAHQPLPPGPRVGVVTNASGPAALAVDTLRGAGLAPFDPFASSAGGEANPFDLSAFATPEDYREAIRRALASPFDALLVVFAPLGTSTAAEIGAVLGEEVVRAREVGYAGPVLGCFTGAHGPLYAGRERLPSYRFPESAARALARAYAYARWRAEPLGTLPRFDDLDLAAARALCRAKRAQGGGWLDPEEVATLLRAFNLPLASGRGATTEDEAVAAAEALGYPVVLKLATNETDVGDPLAAPKLGLTEGAAVRRAFGELRRARSAEAGPLRVWVQKMVPEGTGLTVGVQGDPLFGPLVSFGVGGLYSEVLRDRVLRVTPLTDRDAAEMVRSVRSFPLLLGYRGHPASDLKAVEETLLRVSRLVEELPEVTELELNPLRAFAPGQGVVVLSARVKIGGQ
jgi:acyl-CoA synthetase (NDP forming)/GNAT superfamily N-acetyltransferase